MKHFSAFVLVFTFTVTNGLPTSARASLFINEIHYDNLGTDVDEGIEIAGPAGENLTDWSIAFYNGGDGGTYKTFDLSGIIPNQQNGFGTMFVSVSGIQNGAPDGLALIDDTDSVIQFLSYEGAFSATEGPASGLFSTNIGVFEESNTPVGHSLQLIGSGTQYEDFSWMASPMTNTRGDINTGQAFVPIPGAVWLLGSGLMGIGMFRRRKM